ncbi:hypothetical protein KSC_064880 [Ktedonobacter sp. SOSP1-52]|uniref:hypothetical protein n=1 Tax=Ktedonobacter sp. SOSP1-52 TaxID=2778366 RepID=UPI001915228F|nr:hypothetical protein [Ktedonobacter sp. SOSP1-52]GHO67596.1 hypothetical protein KSC_064880 [Ktedonobacter sp. SOSP1-52]
MIVTPAYPIQVTQPPRPQESDPRGPRRTIHMLTERVNDLLSIMFSGDDEYVVVSCAEPITATLALNFQTTFQEERPVQAVLVSYGKTNTSGDGYIVIRWRGTVPESFFDQLDQLNKGVLFYIAFSAGPLDTCKAPWDGIPNA